MLDTIISTGFEGPERQALEVARRWQHPWGGACPLGRSGQFGPIPDQYFTEDGKGGLVEGSSSRPTQARLSNARSADGTLILCRANEFIPPLCKTIIVFLRRQRGRYKVVDPTQSYSVPQTVRWIVEYEVRILNVSASPKKDDDPFTKRSGVFMSDILSYTTLHERRGVKIWT